MRPTTSRQGRRSTKTTLPIVLQLSSSPTVPSRYWSRALGASRQVHQLQRALQAEAVALGTPVADYVEAKAFARSVSDEFENYVKLDKRVPPEPFGASSRSRLAKLGDTVASHLALKFPTGRRSWRHGGHGEAGEAARFDRQRDFGPAGREAHPQSRQAADGEDAARVFSPRADEGDPERDRDEEGNDDVAKIEEIRSKDEVSKEAREKGRTS